jgi:hypothetical protein
LKARKAHHLLESIRSVERFTGEPRELELVLDEMEAVHGLITHTKIDATIDQDIWLVFVSRMSRQVLMETGLRYSSSWEEINVTLNDRYAGAKKPVARYALSLLRMNRCSGESGAEFARHLGEGTRILYKKIREAVDNTHDAAVTTEVLDKLLWELLLVVNNHRGVAATLADLRRRFYWWDIVSTIRDHILRCDVCAQAKNVRTPREQF